MRVELINKFIGIQKKYKKVLDKKKNIWYNMIIEIELKRILKTIKVPVNIHGGFLRWQ